MFPVKTPDLRWVQFQKGLPGCSRIMICFYSLFWTFVGLTSVRFLFLFLKGCFLFIYVLAELGLHCCAQSLLYFWREGATLCWGARASPCGGFPCCGAQALEHRSGKLWRTGLVVPWHVGSSRTRDWIHDPRIGRQIPNHWTTSEVLFIF